MAQATKPEPDLLYYSITGFTTSSSPAENATYAMVHHEVQRLLLDVAQSPRDRAYVEKALTGSGVTLDDMVSNGSLRLRGGRYWLNFNFITLADQEIIRRASETYSLADVVLKHKQEIEALLKQYDLKEVDPKAVAFMVLGCFSFDWNGLYFSTKWGYRAEEPKHQGGEFFVMAEEAGARSQNRFRWGSNNSQFGRVEFTRFGGGIGMESARRSGPDWLRELSENEFGTKVGAIMVSLRSGAQTRASIATVADLPVSKTHDLLNTMERAGWIAKRGDTVHAIVPVLTERDRSMVQGLLKIGYGAMKEWLAANYEPFRAAVKDITPVRHGVPYPQTFDLLWHYVFGTANQKLVEAGLFVDPYAKGTVYPGNVSAFWEHGINNVSFTQD